MFRGLLNSAKSLVVYSIGTLNFDVNRLLWPEQRKKQRSLRRGFFRPPANFFVSEAQLFDRLGNAKKRKRVSALRERAASDAFKSNKHQAEHYY